MNCFGGRPPQHGMPSPAAYPPNGSPPNGSAMAPPAVPRQLSYVPPVAVPQPQPPYVVPQKLTDGIPDPSEIAKQKDGYAKGIDMQFRQGSELLNSQHKQTTEWLHSNADQQKAQAILAIDQQVKQEELQLSQQYNEQLMLLHQAAQRQRAELEQQANNLALEYQTKKTQEEFMRQQYSIQKNQYEQQVQLIKDMEGMGVPVVPQGPNTPWSMSPPQLQPPGSVSVGPGMMQTGMVPPQSSYGMQAGMVPPSSYGMGAYNGAAMSPSAAMSPYGAPPAPMGAYQAPMPSYHGASTSWVQQASGSWVPQANDSYVTPAPTQSLPGQMPPSVQVYSSSPIHHTQLPTQVLPGGANYAPPETQVHYHTSGGANYAPPVTTYYSEPSAQQISETSGYYSPRTGTRIQDVSTLLEKHKTLMQQASSGVRYH